MILFDIHTVGCLGSAADRKAIPLWRNYEVQDKKRNY